MLGTWLGIFFIISILCFIIAHWSTKVMLAGNVKLRMNAFIIHPLESLMRGKEWDEGHPF